MFYNVFWHIIKAEFSIYSTFFMYFFNKNSLIFSISFYNFLNAVKSLFYKALRHFGF